MKKIIFIVSMASLLSCEFDLNFDPGYQGVDTTSTTPPPNAIPASFKIYVDGVTYEINGDAYVSYWTFYGPGSAIYEVIDSYVPLQSHFQFEALSTRATVPNVIASVRFDFYGSKGVSLQEIGVGTYTTLNSQFYTPDMYFKAFNNSNPEINQQLGAEITVTKVENQRMDGYFTGRFYQAIPETGRIITITGEFKDVPIF